LTYPTSDCIHNRDLEDNGNSMSTESTTFGGGCFWCLEAVFQQLAGIQAVISGYTDGDPANPTYEQVCSGTTNHAEVCQLEYDPSIVSFQQLLEVFFRVHDPTTLNRQGNDVGTQYRSAIFCHDELQQTVATQAIELLDNSSSWDSPIVTQVAPLGVFYPAEEYHQDYFRRNPFQGYCAAVVAPKVDKFRAAFAELLAG
jgi:peptide-methionine (S)-S-oxide reductase